MLDKIIIGCVELGTYSTDAPNPHVNLSGNTPGIYGIEQSFVNALSTGETLSVTVRKDVDNWTVYKNVTFTTGTPNILDLTLATTLETSGAISNADDVECIGIYPDANNTIIPFSAVSEIIIPIKNLTTCELIVDSLIHTVDVSAIYMTISTDDASTWKSTSYRYGMLYSYSSATEDSTNSSSAANMVLILNSGNATGEMSAGSMRLTGIDAGYYFRYNGKVCNDHNSVGFLNSSISGGYFGNTDAVTHIKIYPSSGTVTGRFILRP